MRSIVLVLYKKSYLQQILDPSPHKKANHFPFSPASPHLLLHPHSTAAHFHEEEGKRGRLKVAGSGPPRRPNVCGPAPSGAPLLPTQI
jgi:hypothetical protein